MPTPPTDTPGARRPAGVSRASLFTGLLATAGTLAVAFLGLGGPPAPAAPVALADATATQPAPTQVVVRTVYVQLPSPTAVPAAPRVAAPATPAPRVVTRQSGSGGEGGEGGEQEGND